MAVYPLTPFKKGSNTLNPHSSYYTEEYAQNLCGWYLSHQYQAPGWLQSDDRRCSGR